MEFSISEAQAKLEEIIDLILNRKEQSILVTKNGIPVVQISPIACKDYKRIGAAKEEMDGFDISLEEFNAISTHDFGV